MIDEALHHLPTLLALLLVVGIVLYIGTVWSMARMLTRPPRMTDGKALARMGRLSPDDVGLAYEPCSFTVRDERTAGALKLAGWWMSRAGSDVTAILIHGYADAKVGALAWAPLLHSLGYNILAIDLRAHGESDGTDTTAGYFERHDIDQVINQIHAQQPAQTHRVILFGISLGAAVAAAVGAMRNDLSAVILDGPYADFASAVRAHGNMMGMPGEAFIRPSYWLAQKLTGARFDEVRPADSIRNRRCPVMVITGVEDQLIGAGAPAALCAAVESKQDGSVYWDVENACHVLCLAVTPEKYEERVRSFLAASVQR